MEQSGTLQVLLRQQFNRWASTICSHSLHALHPSISFTFAAAASAWLWTAEWTSIFRIKLYVERHSTLEHPLQVDAWSNPRKTDCTLGGINTFFVSFLCFFLFHSSSHCAMEVTSTKQRLAVISLTMNALFHHQWENWKLPWSIRRSRHWGVPVGYTPRVLPLLYPLKRGTQRWYSNCNRPLAEPWKILVIFSARWRF